MAIELVSGRVQYSFDLGGGSRVLPDSGQRLVNDGLWHTVYVSRPTVDRHTLTVNHTDYILFNSFDFQPVFYLVYGYCLSVIVL